jgi:hypothetical protein
MIESKELRIGNLIYNPVQKINLVVDGGLIATESMREKAVKDYKGFEPIPLTEEWLIKFGFDIDIDNNNVVCGLYKTIEVALSDKYKVNFYIDDDNGGSVQLGIKVKHVHTLQNLYFALTGEELKIK